MTAVSMILETVQLTLGTLDVTDQLQKVETSFQTDEKDVTTFAADGAKVVKGGLESGSLKLTLMQDMTSGGLDDVMWAAFKSRTPISFHTQLVEGTVTATNPSYSGLVLIDKWIPINGSPGDEAKVDVEFPTSGPTLRSTTS